MGNEHQSSMALKISLALVAMAGVAYQVALVRLLSVVLWYHFAFLVVSTAVLGFGLSGMAMVFKPGWGAVEGLEARLARIATALTASIVAGYLVLAWVPFDPFRMGVDPLQIVWGGSYVAAMMVPFFLNGLFVGATLVSHARESGRLYAFDLVGAGAAALIALGAFSFIGGERTLLLATVFAAFAGLVIARTRWTILSVVVALLATTSLSALVPLRVTSDKVVGDISIAEILDDPARTLETRWNALARVDVVSFNPGRRDILLDAGVALTRIPRVAKPIVEYPPSKDFLALGFALVQKPSVLVLGSGGGWEVANALTHNATKITAVELNPAIAAIAAESQAEWNGGIFADPRVDLIIDEARAFLNRSDATWDVIVSAHTISNAATSSGSMNLAESHTLTTEAFESYLAHLSDRGVLYMTRPESQMPKLVATASAALRARNLTTTDRIVVFRFRGQAPGKAFTAGMIVVRDPAVLDGIVPVLNRHQGDPIWVESARVQHPRYAKALSPDHGMRLATDDRPFFNFSRDWSDLGFDDVKRVYGAGTRGRIALEGEPVAEVSVLVLLVLVLLVSALFTAVPIYLRRRTLPDLKRHGVLVAAYFAALGLGYMYAELGLVHRLGVFLGSPTVTFGVVVAGMLLFSGAGAAVSQRLDLRYAPAVLMVGAVVLVAVGGLSSLFVPWALTMQTSARVGVAIATIAPVGFLLGMAFPFGMRRLGATEPGLLPIAWGVNGFASVVGSATSIVFATGLGFSWLLASAGFVYVVAAVLLTRFARA